MKLKSIIIMLVCIILLFIPTSAIEHNEDSYYCDEGEILLVQNMGVFSDRWVCTHMNEAEDYITDDDGIFEIYFNQSVYSAVNFYVNESDTAIIDTYTTEGRKYIFGGEFT